MRKEARRKLRVSWKSDDTLTEVRIFSHHPDEEVGHADSMMRDVDDVGGEGRMLKMHKDLDEIDDDEEARAVGEAIDQYSPPSEIDFTEIDEEGRKLNFIKRGGTQVPESPEKAAQEQHEQTSLMVVYALPSDVPPSPKEPPPAADDDDYSPPTPFGEPTDDKVRNRERQYYASNAQQARPLSDLERTFGMFSQYQQSQQPQVQAPAIVGNGGFDLSRILAAVQQTQQPQNIPLAFQPQPQQQQSAAPDLASLLATLQQSQQQQPPQHTSIPGFPFLQPQNAPEDYSRKHGYEEDEEDSYEGRQSKRSMLDDPKAPNYKTVVCKFWKDGKCRKGDECTYIHD